MDTDFYMTSSFYDHLFNALAAIAFAYSSRMSYRLKKLTLESKEVSESNSRALQQVATLGVANAEAIEHTRTQNVKIASQNDNLAEQVGHVHICVETRVAELKEVVERVPETVKEAVPEAIKEVLPDMLKETVPPVLKEVIPEVIKSPERPPRRNTNG